jgi:hypothetical protein
VFFVLYAWWLAVSTPGHFKRIGQRDEGNTQAIFDPPLILMRTAGCRLVGGGL